jgi:hypothetical protein
MTVEVGAVYKSTSKNLLLIIVSRTALSARCAVLWSNQDVETAYRVGDMDTWGIKVIEESWERVS